MSSHNNQPLINNQHPLSGMRILLTRAGTDNDHLATNIRNQGGFVLTLPCLRIDPVNNPTLWQSQLQQLSSADGIIFTSRYAVEYSTPHWPKLATSPALYAVGPTTATAVINANLPTPIVPKQYDSNGLLALTELQQVTDQQWFIIGGENPRMQLQDTLSSRGAKVNHIACYQRNCPKYSPDAIKQLAREHPTLIIVQSLSCLRNLANILKLYKEHDLWSATLLLPQESLAATAAELGFVGTRAIANNATDAAMLNCLLTHCGQTGKKI